MLMGLLSMTISCVEEVDTPIVGSPVDEAGSNKVSFIIEDFIPEGQTKSAAQITASGINFQWSANDVIGVFPDEGYQVKFAIKDGAGSDVAVFDGGSWGLKQGENYYAYYPFDHANFESEQKREQAAYSYDGQVAAFADNNGIVDLSGYDFMASGAGTVENGNVSFTFKHLGALCRVRITAPATDTYVHLAIDAGADVIPVSGYFDATDKDDDGIISLVGSSEEFDNWFVLGIPEAHQSFEEDEEMDLYFLMPPVDLSGQNPKLILYSEENCYTAELEPKNIQAGRSYEWAPATVEIYTGPSVGAETANCYIVSEAGTYSFATVRGNGSSYIGGIASVEVIWESFGTDVTPSKGSLISEVSYSDDMITYSTPATFKEGNAVIAAKSAAGVILWSWHIWLTDKPADHTYNNSAGKVMDRNLGAISTTPGDVGAFGLMYQWGRKDPFLGAEAISSTTKAKSVNSVDWSVVSSDESTGTIAYATANPTTYISGSQDWLYVKGNTTLWQSEKTIYDPCPAGYRVPDGGADGVFEKAFGRNGNFYTSDIGGYDSTNRGYNVTGHCTSDSGCWYPAAGYIYGGSLSFSDDGSVFWTCTADGNGVYETFLGSYMSYMSSSSYKANAQSVRCLKIESSAE